jgi:REP-associated tyrosine transposase
MDIFRSTVDYELFLYVLRNAALQFRLNIHAYVLMTNHVHLLVTPVTPRALASTMQAVGRRYVPYFNRQYQRTGGLFEGRYRSIVVGDEAYWMTCMRYVELNPVRAGLVTVPDAYRWSSYRAHALGIPDVVVTDHPLYLRLGPNPSDRRRSWQALCAEAIGDDELQLIRTAVNSGQVLNRLVLPDTPLPPAAQP